MDQFNLDVDWGPSNFDVQHKFVLSGTYQLPWDMMVSGILFIRSGFPYSAMGATDWNGDGYSRNERALIETSPDVWFRYSRNTFRQEYFRNLDLRLSKIFRFGRDLELEIIGEVFNVTNEENWYGAETELVNRYGEIQDDFGESRYPGDPRGYQLGLKFRF